MKHSVKEVHLKNGAKGLLVHVPGAEVMSIDINFRAGDALCDPNKWETAHLMEHLTLGANQQYRSGRKFSAVLEQNGAYSNASTNAHDITYEAECADFEWDRVLDLMVLAIGKPLFLESEFKAEFSNVSEELVQRGNNHGSRLALEIAKAVGLTVKTWQDRQKLLKNVTLDDVRAHYKMTHFTRNMRFVIAGNLSSERMGSITKKLEAIDLPQGDQDRIGMPDDIPKLVEPIHVANETVPNIYFDFDTYKLGGRFADPERYALVTVNSILNGTLHSRILGRAREKGLVYSIGSGWSWSRNYTGWGIGAQVSRENAPALFELMVREIRRVLNGKLDLKDLQAAKDYIIGSDRRSGQTVGSIAGQYTGFYFATDDIIDYDGFVDNIRSITRPRAIAAFQKVFEDELWALGFLGTCTEKERSELTDRIKHIWH